MVTVLKQIAKHRGKPAKLFYVTGIEFTSQILNTWADQNQIGMVSLDQGTRRTIPILNRFMLLDGGYLSKTLWVLSLGNAQGN